MTDLPVKERLRRLERAVAELAREAKLENAARLRPTAPNLAEIMDENPWKAQKSRARVINPSDVLDGSGHIDPEDAPGWLWEDKPPSDRA